MSFDSGSVLVAGARTPMGRFQGSLAGLSAVDLGACAIAGALDRAGVAAATVDYVIMGQVLQAGTGQMTARQAAVKAGIGMDVPALTINKVCGSGLKAAMLGAQAIACDLQDEGETARLADQGAFEKQIEQQHDHRGAADDPEALRLHRGAHHLHRRVAGKRRQRGGGRRRAAQRKLAALHAVVQRALGRGLRDDHAVLHALHGAARRRDAQHHARNAARTRDRKIGQGRMFPGLVPGFLLVIGM